MQTATEILNKPVFSKNDIVYLLGAKGEDFALLKKKAFKIKQKESGPKIFFRGLVEFSNHCAKDCYYCGIRTGNSKVLRYEIPDEEILAACKFAWQNGYGSVVLQSGENTSPAFVKRVDGLLRKIKQLSNNTLAITLSCGEQSRETYKRWFESGSSRYLLRVEATNRELYYKIHPKTKIHSYENRLTALGYLRETGYQVGTGVMIGLPFQTMEDLAGDLLFFKSRDIDMCGMGPFVEHENTPLYKHRNSLLSSQERFNLAIKMIAVLRLMMPNINIASATALEALNPQGRLKALEAGANVIMPNLTPLNYRKAYCLYKNKPGLNETITSSLQKLISGIEKAGYQIGWNENGNSEHFNRRANAIPSNKTGNY